MRTQRDYYEILGLPPTASAAEIKRKYRELARKFHPDVLKDKSFGHRAFVQITEAYKTLSDPEARRVYDASRPPRAGRTETPRPSGQPRHTGARPSAAPSSGRRTDSDGFVRDAEFAFIRGRLNEAASFCRQAILHRKNNARAHAILGDIYRIQGKKEQAILEYTYAVQFDPTDRASQGKLEKLLQRTARTESRRRERIREDIATPRSAAVTANMVGWSLGFFLLFLINVYQGDPIPGLGELLPGISTWSWTLVVILSLDAALVGALLSANRLLAHPDEELVFQHMPATMIPIGLPLLVFSMVFFYGAAAALLLMNLLQGVLSKSLVLIFAVVTAITLLAALMYEPGRWQVALYGGNVAFPSAVVGWYIGRLFGPLD